ncbi:MAG: gliding motility protein GldM [Saprospiraceae bacterium]
MSIPKEPRQLMINLMYLVLTALLALNISAEVMNAFFTLDKGISNSNDIVDNTNAQILSNIQKQADAYKNDQNDAYNEAAKKSDEIVREFAEYVNGIRTNLFNEAGGPSEKDPSKPEKIKDKDITTRLFIKSEAEGGQDLGNKLEAKIKETREKLLALVDNDPGLTASLPLAVTEDWKKSDKNNWAEFNFLQMPVAAVFPILRKVENDARASNSAVLNFLFKKVSGEEIKFDAFEPVTSASKGYVIKGETYTADVFLSAYSTSSSGNTRIIVNGSSLPVKDGKATYQSTASSIGTKQYNVQIDVTNPLTKEVKTYKKTFEYEVGERSVAVSADKMNVFYIGVKNPISVSAAGISSNDLNVSINGGGGSLAKTGSNSWDVTVKTPGEVKINVSGGGLTDSKVFRVKRIPDPVAKLGNKPDGAMGNGEFKAQQGLIAWLENFDFDARCDIQDFTLVRVPKREDPINSENQGGSFNAKSKRLVDMARPGDTYYFQDVKARCPGDGAGRKINSLVFTIK